MIYYLSLMTQLVYDSCLQIASSHQKGSGDVAKIIVNRIGMSRGVVYYF